MNGAYAIIMISLPTPIYANIVGLPILPIDYRHIFFIVRLVLNPIIVDITSKNF